MSGNLFLKCGLFATTGMFVETKYVDNKENFFGVTPLLLIGTGFWATLHAFQVGKARTKYSELAKADGEPDVDERYGLPNLYAQGTSKHAKAFNCVQRSHQQIFEHFTQVCVAGLVGAVSFPITTAISVLAYAVGRYKFSIGYCSGEPEQRYASPLSRFMWYGMLSTYILGIASSAKMILDNRNKNA
jgi:glutathione S-transferase